MCLLLLVHVLNDGLDNDLSVGAAALFLLLWLSLWTAGTSALLSQVVGLWRGGSIVAAIPMTIFALGRYWRINSHIFRTFNWFGMIELMPTTS